MNKILKFIAKSYIKKLNKDQRALRIVLVGKRLAYKQVQYLYFNNHPWDAK